MGDVKENAMAGGIASRLRGLDANGNSISPSISEINQVMPEAGVTWKGLMSASFFNYVFHSPVANTYTGGGAQLTTCDGQAQYVNLGAYYIVPEAECSLYGKGDGMVITMRRSFLTVQIFFARSGDVYCRTSPNFVTWNPWKKISFTS